MKLGLGLSLTALRASGFNPGAALLPGAAALAWHDPSDLTTMFQDRAGTTPVTAAGQTVGHIRDKAGGYHLTAVSDAARGIYQTSGGLHWIEFDGVNDGYVTPTITPGVDKVQVFAGVRKLSDAARGVLLELGTNVAQSFRLEAPNATGSIYYSFASVGSAAGFAGDTSALRAAPNTSVLTGLGDISGDSAILRVNGVQVAINAGDQGTGNFGPHVMYLGRRGGTTLPFNGRWYGSVVRFSAANLDAGLIDQTERWMGAKAGLTW